MRVVDFDQHGNVTGIEEKPKKPKSNYTDSDIILAV